MVLHHSALLDNKENINYNIPVCNAGGLLGMPLQLSRRALLVGGAGVGVASVAGAGALQFALADPATHVKQALRRLFGPFNMASNDLTQFADDFNGMLVAKEMSVTKVR